MYKIVFSYNIRVFIPLALLIYFNIRIVREIRSHVDRYKGKVGNIGDRNRKVEGRTFSDPNKYDVTPTATNSNKRDGTFVDGSQTFTNKGNICKEHEQSQIISRLPVIEISASEETKAFQLKYPNHRALLSLTNKRHSTSSPCLSHPDLSTNEPHLTPSLSIGKFYV